MESALACLVGCHQRSQQGTERIVSESKVLRDLITQEGSLARLVRSLWRSQRGTDGASLVAYSPLVWIKRCMSYQPLSLSMLRQPCVRGVAAVLNSGVHGSRSGGYGGNHLGSPNILFIGKGQSGSHRGVGVGGTDQLSLSPLSERKGPDQPLLTLPFLHQRRALPILQKWRGKHAWNYGHVSLV